MLDLTGADVTYLLAGLALILALVVPPLVSRVAISSPIVLLGVGIVLGLSPLTDHLPLDPERNRAVIEHVTELTVIISLMGVGLALDRQLRPFDRASRRAWSPTWRLLGIAMPLCIAAVTGLGWLAGLSLPLALLLGAALAPTDPVLASDVQVGGPVVDLEDEEGDQVDERSEVRFALTSEAGLNDGLAFPFLYGAVLLAAGGSFWSGFAEWIGWYVVVKVTVGVLVGTAIGWVLGRLAFRSRLELVRIAERGDPLLALAALLTAYGVSELLQGYGFLAVFACAVAMRSAERHHSYHRGMHDMIERLELLFTLLGLLFIGIALGSGLLSALTWWGVAIGVALVLVIRPLTGWLALSIRPRPASEPGGLDRGERAAVAFFGVRGIGSVYYLAYGTGEIGTTVDPWLWATVAFTIVLSVVVHGVTATPAMQRLEQRPTSRE